jgi:hypothetical protein
MQRGFYVGAFATDISNVRYVCLLAYNNLRKADQIFTKIDIVDY